jgi:putative ABC transport system permease protein
VGYQADRTGPLLVALHHPERAEAVRDQLNAASNGKYRAWTRAELSKANETMVFQETAIVSIILGFVTVMGLIIGIIITALTLRGAILANIKELASLRALGISVGSLRLVMLELAFWVGLIGLTLSAGLIYAVARIGAAYGLPMGFPLSSIIGMAVLLMTVAMMSGVFSLGLLKKSQPADLLR